MKNYAGHRLSPWLGHLMVSRQETARPLLTPGEVMQLPASDELVLVSGCPPIRAKKARYFEDPRLQRRILRPPAPGDMARSAGAPPDGWSGAVAIKGPPQTVMTNGAGDDEDSEANAGFAASRTCPSRWRSRPRTPRSGASSRSTGKGKRSLTTRRCGRG